MKISPVKNSHTRPQVDYPSQQDRSNKTNINGNSLEVGLMNHTI